MSINLKCLFKNGSGTVQFQDGRTNDDNNKDFMKKEIAIIVKVGIVFGIIASLFFLALSIIYFKVPVIEGQEDHGGHTDTGCQIYPFVVDPSPIIVISGSDDFIYPKPGEKNLRFFPGQSVDIICPGGRVIWGHSRTNNSVISGSCVKESTLKISNEEVNWRDIRCSDPPLSTIRITSKSCYNNSTELEVGFELFKNRFLRSMLICFNQKLQIAHYSYVKLPASINQRVLYTKRPKFRQGTDIYDIGKVDNLYLRKNQRSTVNRLLGLSADSTQYIQDNNNYFLSRGHLTANMDNFYAAQQNATFFYQNVAPQWQTFNGYNWNQIEIDVRDYAEANAVDLHVWTGVYGVATLPHKVTKQAVELFLFVNSTATRKALPVPNMYWKVVFNPVTNNGIALIGVNNPYLSSYDPICKDVSQKLTWLNYERENQQKGFCYACSVEDFNKIVAIMPNNITINGLLL